MLVVVRQVGHDGREALQGVHRAQRDDLQAWRDALQAWALLGEQEQGPLVLQAWALPGEQEQGLLAQDIQVQQGPLLQELLVLDIQEQQGLLGQDIQVQQGLRLQERARQELLVLDIQVRRGQLGQEPQEGIAAHVKVADHRTHIQIPPSGNLVASCKLLGHLKAFCTDLLENSG